MNKNLKLFYSFCFAMSAIILAWNSLAANLLGVGVNFALIACLFSFLLILFFVDATVRARTKDLLILTTAFVAFEFVVYFFTEVIKSSSDALNGVNIFQRVISLIGLLLLAYIVFRFIGELKGKKFGFIEKALGDKNVSKQKKVKENKELTNGSLMEKPSHRRLRDESLFDNIVEDENSSSEIELDSTANTNMPDEDNEA